MVKSNIDLSEIVNSAVEEGVGAIVEEHKGFKRHQQLLLKHIDSKVLKKKVGELYQIAQRKNFSEDKTIEYIRDGLADYVSTGAVFDDYGQNKILRTGLREKAKKGFFRGFSARRELEGEEYFDNILVASQNLYELFKTGEYSEKLKNVADAATTLNDFHFLDNALDMLQDYGVMDKGKYQILKRQLRERAKYEGGRITGGIENYLTPQKIAASVFMVLGGLYLAFFGIQRITGNIIGNTASVSNFAGIVIGILFLIIGFFFLKKKSNKKTRKKIKKRARKKRSKNS